MSGSAGGVAVNADSMLGLPAVYNGVSILASIVGNLSLLTYERKMDGSRERSINHPAYRLLKKTPSPILTPFMFFSTVVCQIKTNGNSFALIDRQGANPVGLNLVDPMAVSIKTDRGKVEYEYQSKRYQVEELLHFKNLSNDGIQGLSVCSVLRRALGESLAQVEFASSAWKNGTRIPGYVGVPAGFDADDIREFQSSFNEKFAGPTNAGKMPILPGGITLNPFLMPLEDAEFLAQREFSLTTLANIVGCPSHWLGGKINTSYSSLTEENRGFLLRQLNGMLTMIEQECELKLLSEKEKALDSHYIEFMRESLLAADPATENTILTNQLNNGQITMNEYLAIKNKPGIGPEGNRRRIPANIIFTDQLKEGSNGNPPEQLGNESK